jgi:hypothetical protein
MVCGSGCTVKGADVEDKRQVYTLKRQAELRELIARLELIESQAEKADAEAKLGYNEQIYELREKRKEVADHIEDLKTAEAGNWNDLKKQTEEAILDFRTALDVAATRFN